MKLPAPSIRKLFKDNLTGASPIVVMPPQRAAMAKSLTERVAKIEGVQLSQHPGDRDSRARALCRFLIPDSHNRGYYFRDNELRLEIDEEHRLVLVTQIDYRQQQSTPVSDFEEIENLVHDVLSRYARQRAAANKREKVRQFKLKAITAQIKRLAHEEKFDFALENDQFRARLFVKLSSEHLIEITIPLKSFDTVLPKLQAHIQTLRSLYADGLRFQIATPRRLSVRTEWIRHDAV